MPSITVSIVSHGHGALVERLVPQLLKCPDVGMILLTLNIPETLHLPESNLIRFIKNQTPKGFGENHNNAFLKCDTQFFAVVNPDIALAADPFPDLLLALRQQTAFVVGPVVQSSTGAIEDSIRPFPTVARLFRRVFRSANTLDTPMETRIREKGTYMVDWVAGMFMVFARERFAELGGFDTGFFLYCEDVDICVRTWNTGGSVLATFSTPVTHDARRDSRRRLKFLTWHIQSFLRYFRKHAFRLPPSRAWIRVG